MPLFGAGFNALEGTAEGRSGAAGKELELPVVLASAGEGRKADSEQTHRADPGLGAFEKTPCHGRDLARRRHGMGKGAAAGRGLRVRIAQLQNDPTGGDALEAERSFEALSEAIELLAEDHDVDFGASEGRLLGEASGVALTAHPAVALAARQGLELEAPAVANRLRKDRRVHRRELAHPPHAELGKALLRMTADAREPCHGKVV